MSPEESVVVRGPFLLQSPRLQHERKFDREQIAETMRRTVTHVGLNDLSDEQWIAIALRYAVQVLAPRPATSEEQCRCRCDRP